MRLATASVAHVPITTVKANAVTAQEFATRARPSTTALAASVCPAHQAAQRMSGSSFLAKTVPTVAVANRRIACVTLAPPTTAEVSVRTTPESVTAVLMNIIGSSKNVLRVPRNVAPTSGSRWAAKDLETKGKTAFV